MTKEELAQLRYLRREVEGDKERLRQLQHWAKAQSSPGKLLTEQYEKPVRRLEKRIQRNLQTHLEQLERLESFLAGVEDSRMRLILELRSGRGLTWQQVAVRMGVWDEQVPRRWHNRFLACQEIGK